MSAISSAVLHTTELELAADAAADDAEPAAGGATVVVAEATVAEAMAEEAAAVELLLELPTRANIAKFRAAGLDGSWTAGEVLAKISNSNVPASETTTTPCVSSCC